METISAIDWGPIYQETHYGRWPVEPWNTATTLFFLLLVIYWAFQIRGDLKTHRLLSLCLPMILVGFVGGFLYHSRRDHVIWLLMDWVPIALTALTCSAFYWRTLISSWWISGALTLFPLMAFVLLLRWGVSRPFVLSLGYPLLVVSVLAPLIFGCRGRPYHCWKYLLFSMVTVLMALLLRFMDRSNVMAFLPMGTHFLWHTLGALTCHFFAQHNYENPPILKEN